MAAPAWRQFSFFTSTPSSPTPPLLEQPALISVLHSNPSLNGDSGLVLLADLEGRIHLLNEQWEPERSWTAYEGGRVTLVESAGWDSRKGRVVVATVGDDSSTPFPVLKLWLLTLPVSSAASTSVQLPHLTLLRSCPINPVPSRPSPVSALALSPSLSHVVVGLADGSVIAWKRIDELVEASLNELEDVAAAALAPAQPAGRGKEPKRRAFTVGGMGKLRVLWEGDKEPVTSVACTSSPADGGMQTLFILTTSQILSLPLPSTSHPQASRYKHATPTVLDEHGAAVGCAKVLRLTVPGEEGISERMVVAREEAVYVYGAEGREGCWAYEGPKSSIVPLALSSSLSSSRLPTPYLAILTPPQTSTLASHSATIRSHAASRSPLSSSPVPGASRAGEDKVGKVTVFDPENKFVAFSAPFGDASAGGGEAGVRDVVEAWGAVWVVTEGGRLYRLVENPLPSSLAQLYSRNLYALAVGVAQSRGLGREEVADIYRRYVPRSPCPDERNKADRGNARRYGDHLYSKGDYEGAMGCYLKTVGVVQASYVIRKFLDAQRLVHLTSYLQELHSRKLANSDITTLLLNCYTKLGDSTALEAFIHSSSSSRSSSSSDEQQDEPPFDLETAIRVLRQAGYFAHASWLASRYALHGEYLRIAIEDEGDVTGALAYVRALAAGEKGKDGRAEARECVRRWGGVLLAREGAEATRVMVEICCGTPQPTLAKELAGDGEEDPVEANGTGRLASKGRLADLSAPTPSRRSTVSPGCDVPDAAVAPPLSSSAAALSPSASPAPSSSGQSPSSGAKRRAAAAEAEEDALPSPRLFFPHFVDHPREFIAFLEGVAERRYGVAVEELFSPAAAGEEGDLPEPHPFRGEDDFDEGDEKREERAVWGTLLELYLTPPSSSGKAGGEREREDEQKRFQEKAVRLLRSRDRTPYDETQALLVCAAKGFVDGWVALCEMEGRYEEVVRYWIDASLSSPDSSASSRLIASLRRYAPHQPSLYPLVLRHLTSSSALLSRHQSDVLALLDEVDEKGAMTPIEVVRVLSAGGVAGLGLVREYLKRQVVREREEVDSDLALIASYRSESASKQKTIAELSSPTQSRVFQVTRCAACGGQLDTPMVHFMCRHSYHQRCLPENERQCPNCAASHGVVRELAKANAAYSAPRGHELLQQEIADAGRDGGDGGFRAVAATPAPALSPLAADTHLTLTVRHLPTDRWRSFHVPKEWRVGQLKQAALEAFAASERRTDGRLLANQEQPGQGDRRSQRRAEDGDGDDEEDAGEGKGGKKGARRVRQAAGKFAAALTGKLSLGGTQLLPLRSPKPGGDPRSPSSPSSFPHPPSTPFANLAFRPSLAPSTPHSAPHLSTTPPRAPKSPSSIASGAGAGSPLTSLMQALSSRSPRSSLEGRRSSVADVPSAVRERVSSEAAMGGGRELGRSSREVSSPKRASFDGGTVSRSKSVTERPLPGSMEKGAEGKLKKRPGRGMVRRQREADDDDGQWCLVSAVMGSITSDHTICGLRFVEGDLLILKPRVVDYDPPLHLSHLPFLRIPVSALSTSLTTARVDLSRGFLASSKRRRSLGKGGGKDELVERLVEVGVDDGVWAVASGVQRDQGPRMVLRVYKDAALEQIYALPASRLSLYTSSSSRSPSSSTPPQRSPAQSAGQGRSPAGKQRSPAVHLQFEGEEHLMLKPRKLDDFDRLMELMGDEDEGSARWCEEEMAKRKSVIDRAYASRHGLRLTSLATNSFPAASVAPSPTPVVNPRSPSRPSSLVRPSLLPRSKSAAGALPSPAFVPAVPPLPLVRNPSVDPYSFPPSPAPSPDSSIKGKHGLHCATSPVPAPLWLDLSVGVPPRPTPLGRSASSPNAPSSAKAVEDSLHSPTSDAQTITPSTPAFRAFPPTSSSGFAYLPPPTSLPSATRASRTKTLHHARSSVELAQTRAALLALEKKGREVGSRLGTEGQKWAPREVTSEEEIPGREGQ
ncbi:Vacuolar protein sorting-associated protein 11 [Rhodosporidiobolus nylandii]